MTFLKYLFCLESRCRRRTRGGKSKARANSNRCSSTRRTSAASQCGSTIQQNTSGAATNNNQQRLAPVSPVMLFSSVSLHVPVSTTTSSKVARPLTVNDISSIVQEMVRYLPQFQGQPLIPQPAITTPTFSGDQVRSAPREFTAMCSAHESHPIQSPG